MVIFRILASGSKGNAIIMTVDGVNILIDAGLTYKELTRRLDLCGHNICNISAIFNSHEHQDHVKAVPMFQKKHNMPTYNNYIAGSKIIHHGVPIYIGNIKVTPVSMAHDVECFGFVIEDSTGNKVGYVTDSFTMPCDSLKYFMDCQALIVEFNHDTELVIQGPYPEFLQVRALETHLENTKAADLVNILSWDGLKFVVCHHVSEQNNNKDLIMFEAKRAVEHIDCQVVIADQKIPTDMMTII